MNDDLEEINENTKWVLGDSRSGFELKQNSREIDEGEAKIEMGMGKSEEEEEEEEQEEEEII